MHWLLKIFLHNLNITLNSLVVSVFSKYILLFALCIFCFISCIHLLLSLLLFLMVITYGGKIYDLLNARKQLVARENQQQKVICSFLILISIFVTCFSLLIFLIGLRCGIERETSSKR